MIDLSALHNGCTGCSACAAACPRSCIVMRENAEGFLVPQTDVDACTSCHVCENICPQMCHENSAIPVHSVYAAWSRRADIRESCSSGGVFYELSSRFIQSGGVVFGAVYNDGRVEHQSATNQDELEKFKGSKYVQSNMGNCFRSVYDSLKAGRNVLFSGTPCQIAGLKSFLHGRYTDKLFTVDILCHGVPSGKLFRQYLSFISERHPGMDPGAYRFRIPERWGEYSGLASDSGTVKLLGVEEVYTRLFATAKTFNEACYRCRYTGPQRTGDISLGDFWGIGSGAPFNHDTAAGCSLVLVNTPKGKDAWDSISNSICCELRTFDEAARLNGPLKAPAPRPSCRNRIYRFIFRRGFPSTYLWYVDIPERLHSAYDSLHHLLHKARMRFR